MNISIELKQDSSFCDIDFEQSDIENMWNYLMDDRENFEYHILQYLNTNFDGLSDDWKDNPEFEKLYENLKQLYDEI